MYPCGGSNRCVLTVIPTYNEGELRPSWSVFARAAPEVDILVVDDNSPDGTGQIADELSAKDSRSTFCTAPLRTVWVAHTSLASIGAFEAGYDVLIEMDADCSHQPEQLPSLVCAVEAGADLAIGSRYSGGSTKNWPPSDFLVALTSTPA